MLAQGWRIDLMKDPSALHPPFPGQGLLGRHEYWGPTNHVAGSLQRG